MIALFEKIQNYGTENIESRLELRNMRFMNVINAVFLTVLVILQIMMLFVFKIPEMWWVQALGIVSGLIYYVLVKTTSISFVKVYVCVIPVLFVAGFSIYGVGKGGADKFYLLVCSVLPLLLFEKKKHYIGLVMMSIVAFFFVHFMQRLVDPLYPLEEDPLMMYTAFNFFTIFSVLYFFLKIFKKEISDHQQETEDQKLLVEEKQHEILDSINYAKRIQEAILPPDRVVKDVLSDGFVLYLPKDIVAGDFYWVEEVEENGIKSVLFAVADCTGHGVPGAMVSVICHNSLNRCVREFGLTDPGHILTKCRELVIEHFTESNEQVKDGMDIALCCWNRSTNQLVYSGAHNSLYLVRNGELSEFIGNKQPVGYFENAKEFSTEELEVKQGDRIYLSSDGFPDQFGGEKGKKFKYKPFKQLLLSSSTESTDRQKEIIRDTFTNWKGNYEQLDDVCIIGIEV